MGQGEYGGGRTLGPGWKSQLMGVVGDPGPWWLGRYLILSISASTCWGGTLSGCAPTSWTSFPAPAHSPSPQSYWSFGSTCLSTHATQVQTCASARYVCVTGMPSNRLQCWLPNWAWEGQGQLRPFLLVLFISLCRKGRAQGDQRTRVWSWMSILKSKIPLI